MISQKRCGSLMLVIDVVDLRKEGKCNKLQKVAEFSEIIKEKCQSFYQPYQIVAIDERILKNNNHSGIHPFIKTKPVKLGLKFLVLVDSPNGYKSIQQYKSITSI